MPRDLVNHPETKPLDAVGKRLEGAARILEKNGWCSGMLCSPDGRYCVAGAFLKAVGWKGRTTYWDDAAEALSPKFDAAARRMGFADGNGAVHWNNAAKRTKRQVIARLRAAARGEPT